MTDAEQAAQAAVSGLPGYPQLADYAELLGGIGIERGLVGPREADRIWQRHITNSVLVGDLVAEGSRVVDIGSGAGLPGIPLAIVRPDLQVTLLEPLLRRATFLTEVVTELGLGERICVDRGRAEDRDLDYDVATCRAVASVTKLVGWTRSLYSHGGELIALKGERADEEVAAGQRLLRSLGLEAKVVALGGGPGIESTRAVIVQQLH